MVKAKVKVKVKFALQHSMKAQRQIRVVTLLVLQHRRQMAWVVDATPRPLYPREKESVSLAQEAGWAPRFALQGC